MADPVHPAAAPAAARAEPVPIAQVPTPLAGGANGAVGDRGMPDSGKLDHEVPVGGDRWQELRALLVDPERARIQALERKLANPNLHVNEVSAVLPEAILRRSASDGRLGTALGPVVGDAIKASVRRDPQPLVDAIFPVIGPAIRRAIATALAELVQSLNTTLEDTLSFRGMTWRWEAMRTGKSFGEVVLSHSLLFRVEQLFLIHRDSGLLMEHLTAPSVQSPSPEMVASMMTALRDFARDSFRASEQDSLVSMELGELTVWAESGPTAVLAAVIRGQPPVSYREELQRTLEDVHRAHADDIDRFGTSGVDFPLSAGLLERALVSQAQTRARSMGAWRMWLLTAVVVGTVGWCAIPSVMEQRRFDRFVDQARREPGVVVGSAGRENGRFIVTGLRDPLARDPADMLVASGITVERVDSKWEPYVALRPEFVLRRAALLLLPPPTAQLALVGDTLVATGVASAAWRREAELLARAVPGVGVVRFAALADSADLALRARATELESISLTFPLGSATPVAGQGSRLDTLAVKLRALAQDAAGAQRLARINLIGSADSVGTEQINAALRIARGTRVLNALSARGVPASAMQASSDATDGAGTSRQVRLRITFVPFVPRSPQP